MVTDAGIQAYAPDDLTGIQSLHLCICIKFIEERHSQGEIGIGKQLDSLGLSIAHEQRIYIRFERSLLKHLRKNARSLHQTRVLHISSDYDSAWVKIVIKRLGLAEELGREHDIITVISLTNGCSKSNRNSRFDDHHCIRVILHDLLYHCLDSRGVKEILLRIVIGRRSDDYIVCIRISRSCIKSRSEIKIFFGKISFNILILYRQLPAVDHIDLFRHDIHSHHTMILRKQGRHRQTHISSSRYCNLHIYSFNNFTVMSFLSLLRHSCHQGIHRHKSQR